MMMHPAFQSLVVAVAAAATCLLMPQVVESKMDEVDTFDDIESLVGAVGLSSHRSLEEVTEGIGFFEFLNSTDLASEDMKTCAFATKELLNSSDVLSQAESDYMAIEIVDSETEVISVVLEYSWDTETDIVDACVEAGGKLDILTNTNCTSPVDEETGYRVEVMIKYANVCVAYIPECHSDITTKLVMFFFETMGGFNCTNEYNITPEDDDEIYSVEDDDDLLIVKDDDAGGDSPIEDGIGPGFQIETGHLYLAIMTGALVAAGNFL